MHSLVTEFVQCSRIGEGNLTSLLLTDVEQRQIESFISLLLTETFSASHSRQNTEMWWTVTVQWGDIVLLKMAGDLECDMSLKHRLG